MGTCFTPSNTNGYSHINTNIENKLKVEQRRTCVAKMILLGTRSSGKSSILLQTKKIHDDKLHDIANDKHLHPIRSLCISTIIYLLTIINDTDSIKLLQSLSTNNSRDLKQIGNIISNIWIKYNRFERILSHSYAYRDEFNFNHNIAYFIDNIARIMSDVHDNNDMDEKHESILNREDIIKFHTQNANVCTYEYTINDNKYEIIDAPVPTKKIYYLSDMREYYAAVLYVAALSDYCQTLPEMDGMNAMEYSLSYFDTICNNKYFKRFEMILFLNKNDIFRNRLRTGLSLSMCFDEWNGPNYPNYGYNDNIETLVSGWIRKIEIDIRIKIPNDIGTLISQFSRKHVTGTQAIAEREEYFELCYVSALNFIQDAFVKVNRDPCRVVFCHVINATNSTDIQKVMWDCQNILTRTSLRRGGLMV